MTDRYVQNAASTGTWMAASAWTANQIVGDSFDREMVRDIMLKIRGESKAEYDLSQIAGLIECERLKSKTRKSKSHE